jgi:SOUL heme-binding protein
MGIPVPPLPPLPSLPRPPKLDFLAPPPAEELTKMGRNVWNALQREVQNNLQTLQDDLMTDPTTRIPKRMQQQTQALLQQATNVFAETPVNLSEPPYTLYQANTDYEIRDYSSYTVASTNMVPVGQIDDLYEDNAVNQDNPRRTLAAFNTLTAYYLLGANQEQRPISNTGCFPVVTTTMLGEMRFYIDTKKFGTPPEPFMQQQQQDNDATGTTKSSNSNNNIDFVYETGAIFLEQIPPSRLAVRRFSGFCTAGEMARQKQALLAALNLDGVELDVPHGGTVPHVVFQYNPPYALPVVRRNEIAVAVLDVTKAVEEASLRKLKQRREMDNASAKDDKSDTVGAATATRTVNKSTSSEAKPSTPSGKSTKINGSNDHVIFPDADPWGENA